MRWRIVHLVACVLLTFAAADLLVPQLCSTEEVVADEGTPPFAPDQHDDDCFCCCSHTEQTMVTVILSEDRIVIADRILDERLALGVQRLLYRPPLHS